MPIISGLYQGVGMSFKTESFEEIMHRWESQIESLLADGMSIPEQIKAYKANLKEIKCDLENRGDKTPEAIWGEDFKTYLNVWFISIACLQKLNKMTGDCHHGIRVVY